MLIGLAGLKRSGKDTFARALATQAQKRGYVTATSAFADKVREAAAVVYATKLGDFTDDNLKDEIDPYWDITRRQMLIAVGDVMRQCDPDHWIKLWRFRYDTVGQTVSIPRASPWASPITKPILHIVTDVRRANEAAAIHDLGGVVVLIQRPGVEWSGHINEKLATLPDARYSTLPDDLRDGTWGQHHGDRAVFDAIVQNDCDVAALGVEAGRLLAVNNKEEAVIMSQLDWRQRHEPRH